MNALPISLCVFVKNEEKSLIECIESVRPVVSEVVVVDTGSTDNTIKVAKKFTSRVYQVGFTDFGSIRTLTGDLANMPWILMLDADERLDSDEWFKLEELIDQNVGVQGDDNELDVNGDVIIDSWALPRKRWADAWRTQQVELEAFPDWQVRLYRNHVNRPKIRWERRVHERVKGCIRTEHSTAGPVIHHHQNEHKGPVELARRAKFYRYLYDLDIAEGVVHEEPPVVALDDAE